MLVAERWRCSAVPSSLKIVLPASRASPGGPVAVQTTETGVQDCTMQLSHAYHHMLQQLQSGRYDVVQSRAAWRTTHLLACAAVVQHDVGQCFHAVLVQRRDARAQVHLTAIRRAEALVVARQVALPRRAGSE